MIEPISNSSVSREIQAEIEKEIGNLQKSFEDLYGQFSVSNSGSSKPTLVIIASDQPLNVSTTTDSQTGEFQSVTIEKKEPVSTPLSSEQTPAPATSAPVSNPIIINTVPLSSYDAIISEMAEKYQVPANLIRSVIRAESNFDPNAVSRSGAQGLMQLMPGTASDMGVTNAFDPVQNIEGGTKYLAYLLKRYEQDFTKAVAAYNAGPTNVDRYNGTPPFEETINYVKKVLNK